MKQSKELDNIQDQMKPGVITYQGFLGDDRRKLRDIIESDDAAVKRLGLTHKKVADRLSVFREAGKKGLGVSVKLEGIYEVRVDSARGKLPCPFMHAGLFAKAYTIVRNLETESEIIFTDLNIHLIEEHGFYGGKGSPYRLDPEHLAGELRIRI
jgi:hypothetical protein